MIEKFNTITIVYLQLKCNCYKKVSDKFNKSTIYLLTFCNTEERMVQNIFIYNSNKNYRIVKLSIYNCNNNNNNNNLVVDRLYEKLQKAMHRTRVSLNSKAHQLAKMNRLK